MLTPKDLVSLAHFVCRIEVVIIVFSSIDSIVRAAITLVEKHWITNNWYKTWFNVSEIHMSLR